MDYIIKYTSPIGELTVASDGVHITGLWLKDQKYFGAALSGACVPGESIPVLQVAAEWLDRYFDGQKPDVSLLPLHPNGTPFQELVWKLLLYIPYGKTVSYRDLASHVAQKLQKSRMSAQAVGNAVGKNPVSIIIPCHRVVGANGALIGYAGGLDKKQWLLEFEKGL